MIKKTLNQWLSYLESIHPTEIELGLDRVRMVAERLELIKPAKKVLLVAGTNGKGSTVTYCASIIKAAGFKVGSYMSPHLHVYNERIQLDGVNATDEDVVESFEVIEKARGDISLTYFEMGTLSALYLFKKYKVDVAVLEIGLGGRLDAVNIVDPDVSVVTSIGLDHQDWLGNDISIIATEKAGVFRSGRPAICGQADSPESLFKHAQSISAPMFKKGAEFSLEGTNGSWQWVGKTVDGDERLIEGIPTPFLPLVNMPTAIQASVLLEPNLTDEQIIKGIELASLPGRLQVFEEPFSGMVDVGHNVQAAQLLANHLNGNPVKGVRRVVLAMLDDKDPLGVVAALAPHVDDWYLAGLSGFRGQSVQSLAAKVQGRLRDVNAFDTVADALDELKEVSSAEDQVIILGSFVTVAQAQMWLKEQNNG